MKAKYSIVVLFIFFVINQLVYAQKPSFEDNGIYYYITSDSTVEVTYLSYDLSRRTYYSGRIDVPPMVSYNNRNYIVNRIGSCAFSQHEKSNGLVSVNLPNSIQTIGKWAFENCDNFTALSLPDNVDTIETYAFRGCSHLYDLYLPQNLTYIGESCFESPLLKKVELPSKLQYIDRGNFDYADVVISRSIVPPFINKYDNLNIYSFHNLKERVQIFVPGIALDDYKKYWGEVLINKVILPILDVYLSNCQSLETYSRDLDEALYINHKVKECITSIVFLKGVDDSLIESKIKEGINPNCLYWIPSGQVYDGNNFIDYEKLSSNRIDLRRDYPFGCPGPVNCQSIELSYTPSVWADGQSGWDVITLPFEPTSIEASVSGSIVPITTNSKGNFWLRQYVGSSDDAVYFASTSDGVMKANTPYLIAFPGDKMGKGSLEGQTITFKAKNVTIPVTTIPSIQKNGYTFVGNYDKTADEGGGWTLNAEGSAFMWSETVGDKPFSGYFKGEAPTASSAALHMSFGQMDNTTGLEQNMAELIDFADEVVYTLDGRKVIAKDLKPGLYIKNNKKMMVR